MNLDQHDDINGEFMEKIANRGIIINKKENVDKLPDKDFALIIKSKRRHRKFPICDAKSTILSLLYFLRNINNMPETFSKTAGAKLKEACIKYDVDVPSKLNRFKTDVETNVVEFKKTASKKLSNDDFGLIIDGERKFPLHNKEHVKKAINYFPKIKDDLTDEQKEKLKENISKKAVEFDVQTSLEKNASYDLNPNLLRDMNFRVRNLREENKKPYIKLAHKVKDKEIKIKEASVVLDKLDKENNFDTGKMPAKEVFTNENKRNSIDKYASANEFLNGLGKEKKAQDTDYPRVIQQLLTDDEKNKDLIKKLEEQFDKTLVNDLRQDPETIFESLPEPHQELIKNIVDEVRF